MSSTQALRGREPVRTSIAGAPGSSLSWRSRRGRSGI